MQFYYFLILFISTSCSKNKDDNTVNSKYEGIWKGTYSGSNKGSWIMNVDKNGSVTGTATSDVYSETFSLKGNVKNDGSLSVSFGASSSGATFIGKMSSKSASGTWENKSLDIKGTWNGVKN